jgi:ankyrin repeat protein
MARKNVEFGPLMMAAMSGDLATVTQLLSSGADPDERDSDGATPLMQAALRGHLNLAEMLLDAGADPAARDKGDWTSLHFAAQGRHLEVAQLLLEHGTPIEIENELRSTPLWVAVMNSRGDLRVPELLLKFGLFATYSSPAG